MRHLLAFLPLLFLGACGDLLSVHPLATKTTTVLDSSLLGEWTCVDKDCKGMARVRMGRGEDYDIIWVPGEADGEPLRLQARLVKLGAHQVLDMVAVKDRTLLIPGHFFARIEKSGDTLRFAWLDSEWLRRQAVAGLAHTMVDDKPILSAGPTELRIFFTRFVGEPKAVADTMQFRRVIMPAPPGA